MGYVSASNVLPEELIEQIQKYAEGQTIYIPKSRNKRCKWGENTDTKSYIAERNEKLIKKIIKECAVNSNTAHSSFIKVHVPHNS